MRAWIVVLVVGMVGGCCRRSVQPAPVADIAEPVVLRNTQGGTKVQLLESDGLCSNVMLAIASQDWTTVERMSRPPAGREVKSGTKATLLRRGKDCWKVRVDGTAWWTTSDWVVGK